MNECVGWEVNQSVLCFRRLLRLLTFGWLGIDTQPHFARCSIFLLQQNRLATTIVHK